MARWKKYYTYSIKSLLALFLFCHFANVGFAKDLHIAVASSFYQTASLLADAFQKQTHIKSSVVFASSGVLVTRYKQGADYDLLLVANPAYLKKITFSAKALVAQDQVAYWKVDSKVKINWDQMVANLQTAPVALANTVTAPFGEFTKNFLTQKHIKTKKQTLGMNEQMTYMLVSKNMVSQGFVSAARLTNKKINKDHWITLPVYIPLWIAVLHQSKEEAKYLAFLKTKTAKQILKKQGYQH